MSEQLLNTGQTSSLGSQTQQPSTSTGKKKGSVWPFVIAGVVLLFLLGSEPKKREPEKST